MVSLRVHCLLCLLACGLSRFAAAQSRERTPLLALRAEAAFQSNLAGDVPLVVVYSDSTVLYSTGGDDNSPPRIVSTRLSAARFRTLLDSLNLPHLLTIDSLIDLCPDVTDMTYYRVHSWVPGASRVISVYGFPGGSSSCQRAAPELQVAFRALASLRELPGRQWLPDSVEIELAEDTVSGWAPSERHPVRWPTNWPTGVYGPSRWSHFPNQRVIRMPAAALRQLVDLQNRHASYAGTPILLDSRYWFMSFRLPFPGEAAWRRTTP